MLIETMDGSIIDLIVDDGSEEITDKERWKLLKERTQVNIDATVTELACIVANPELHDLLSKDLFRLNLFKEWMRELEEK